MFFLHCKAIFNAHTHTHTYLIREEFHEEGAQKNDAQTLRVQFTFHQADAGSRQTDRKEEDKTERRKPIQESREAKRNHAKANMLSESQEEELQQTPR